MLLRVGCHGGGVNRLANNTRAPPHSRSPPHFLWTRERRAASQKLPFFYQSLQTGTIDIEPHRFLFSGMQIANRLDDKTLQPLRGGANEQTT